MKQVNIFSRVVQGLENLLQEQNNRFKTLIDHITNMLGVNTDLSGVDALALAAN